MTVPAEEKSSLEWAEKIITDIFLGNIKRVTPEVRKQARWVLRHYPGPARIEQLFKNEEETLKLRQELEVLKGGRRTRSK